MTPTKQQTEDDKAAKAEEKQRVAVAELEEERVAQAATAASSAELEAKAAAEVRVQEQHERIEETREKATEGDPKEFGGQLVTSDNFAIITSTNLGRDVAEIRPAGWVGPGFEFSASRLEELKGLLGKVKKLPKQESSK